MTGNPSFENSLPTIFAAYLLRLPRSRVGFLYSDELREYDELGVAKLHEVSSHFPKDGRKYVQHEIEAAQDDGWRLMGEGAVVLVGGNATTTAPGVRVAFTEIFRERTGVSEADAEAWLADLRAADRCLEGIWGG